MHRTRQVRRLPLPDLFTPVPKRPTWDSLPSAVRQHVMELLAELLHRQGRRQPFPAAREGVADE